MKFLLLIGSVFAVRVSKWGEVSADLSPDAIYEKMASDENVKDYVADGPGGASDVAPAPKGQPAKSSLVQLTNQRVWGEIAEEDSFAYHQDLANAASNEDEYVKDGPGQAYQNDLIKYGSL